VAGLSTTDEGPARRGRSRELPLFHCPYCGEEDLTPHGEDPDGWHCGACLRTFTVRLTGTGVQHS
jgi:transposase-like protein